MSQKTTGDEKTAEPKLNRPFRPTVEIPMFLIMLAMNLGGGVMTNVMLYRVCIKTLNYPEHECELLLTSGPKSNETMQIENEAQQQVSMVMMIHSVVGIFVPAASALFLGSWSDKYGRKPLITWPLFGMAVSSFMTLAFTAITKIEPWWYLVTGIPTSFSGGFPALVTGALCYLTDITTEKERTFRMSIMETGVLMGVILGTICSPYLLDFIGSVPVMAIVAGAYTLAYLFAVLFIKESIKSAEKGSIMSLFDWSLIKDMAKTCVKKRPNEGRKVLYLLLVCSIFSAPFTNGLDYLYTRNKLQWSLETYSIFMVVTTLLSVLGLILGVGVLQKMLKIDDIWLTFLAFISSIFDFIVKALATMTWHMYLGTGISLFRNTSQPILRAMLSKILPSEDLAKVFSLLSISNVVVPMAAPLIFNPLYSATINSFPGSIYLVTAAIYVAITVALFFAKYYLWKYPSPSEKSAECESDTSTKGSVLADNKV